MTDNLKEILYGKTDKVILADGKEYIIREPSLDDLESMQIEGNYSDIKNVKKLTWLSLKVDQPELTEKQVGKLITLSMLNEKHPFLKTLLSVLGIGGTEKNGQMSV